MRKIGPIVAVLATALALGACGGDDEETAKASKKPGEMASIPASQLGGQANAGKLKDLYRKAIAAGQDKLTIIGGAPPNEIKLFEAFAEDFPGIEVRPVNAAGSQVTAKIEAEFSSGKRSIDMAETSVILLLGLQKQARLVEDAVFTANGLDDVYIGPDESFYAGSLTPFGLTINTNAVKSEETPKVPADLLAPRWKGKIAMADTTSLGPGSQVVTAMLASGRYDASYFQKLAAQEPKVAAPTNPAGTTDAVAQGARDVAIPASAKGTMDAKEKGAPIEWRPWAKDNYVAQNCIALLKGAPNEQAARLYMNWLLTPRGAEAIARTIRAYSPLPEAPAPEGLPPLQDLDALPQIPATRLKAEQDKALAVAKQAFAK
jgi:iron(III) transport system substrate-binding protein